MRKTLTLSAGAFFFAGVYGVGFDARAQNLDDIMQCRALTDEENRLRCFDETTKKTAEAQTAALSQTDSPAAKKSFGDDDLQQTRIVQDALPKKLQARLVGLRFTRAGRYIITLDNGQVWRQINGDTEKLRLPRATDDGIPIIVKKGMLGSYMLRTASSKRTIRVERIK